MDYIETVASECIPNNFDSEWMDIDDAPDVDDELEVSDDQIFRPFPDPDDSDFDILMQRDVYNIVQGHQIHS